MVKLNLDENSIIYKYRLGKNAYELGLEYNCSHSKILEILRRNNEKVRSKSEALRIYKLDENYFQSIDSFDKAYFFGLLCTDGCVPSNKKGFMINLQEEDSIVLQTFKKYLKSNHPLYYRKAKNNNHKNQICLSVHSEKIKNDLILNGCTTKKSLTLKFPNSVQDIYMSHFLRGVFDGDGCFSIHKRSSNYIEAKIQLIGSSHFIDGIYNYLSNYLNNIGLYIKKVKNGSMLNLSICNKDDITKLYSILYKDAEDCFIPRKLNDYNKIIETYLNRKFMYTSEPIIQLSVNGDFIKKWDNINQIIQHKEFNFNTQSKQCILRCLSGKNKTAFNFKWNLS